MSICSKCKIEKPDDQYYTYWHSSHKRHYTRRICNTCMSKQKQDRRLLIKEQKLKLKEERIEMIEILTQENKVQPEVLELEPVVLETKKCVMCEEHKPLSEFYQNKQSGYYHTRCRKCHNQYTCKRQHEYYQKKWETCGGSEKVLNKPNTYMDRYQEEQTHWVLKLIGWTQNDNGVWSKEGIKDKDNNWVKVPKVEKVIKVRKARTVITSEDVKKIVELRKQGLLMREIAVIYNCSKTLIGDILMKQNEKEN